MAPISRVPFRSLLIPHLMVPLVVLSMPAVRISAQSLGPADGTGLAATDTGRVRAGMLAPDFTLEAFEGAPVKLSSFRGRKTVVLAFYRGHW